MISSALEYWQERYRIGDTPWDKGKPHPALEQWLEENPPERGARVLIPGCGLGHDVSAWAKSGTQAVGLDLVPEAAELARNLYGTGNFATVEFCTGSVFEPPIHLLGTFDWVFEHTCFCAFDPSHRPLYAQAVASLLRPRGKFLAIFYMRPDHEEAPPFGSNEKELLELFGEDFDRLSSQIAEPTFPGREGREEIWLWQKKTNRYGAPRYLDRRKLRALPKAPASGSF